MKRTISLILALLMVLTVLGTTAMAEDPSLEPAEEPVVTEAEAPAEPAGETPAEPPAAPAEEPPAEPPVEEPAEEPAAPTEEPAAEPTAAPAEEPAAGPTAAPTAEPVAAPVAAPPADNSVVPASLPEEIPEQPTPTPDHRSVNVHANGGYFTGEHAGYDHFLKALDGDKLPKTGDKGKGDPDWYTPERTGYRFLGWFQEDDLGSLSADKALKEGDTVPDEVTDLFAGWMRVLTLDAEPGNFTGGEAVQQNYTRTVDVPNGVMPSVSDVPVFDVDKQQDENVEFVGWYTEKSKVVSTENDGYTTWTVEPQGGEIKEGEALNAGITTLYAGYRSKAATQHVTYYYDWNGINGMWGKCLTSSRPYSADVSGYKLTAEDLLIRYLNWGADDGSVPEKVETQDDLDAYWTGKVFNGYTFLGWSTEPGADKPNVKAGDTVISNGNSLYAVWTKDGDSSASFVKNGGREKNIGPLEFIQFLNLKNSAHGTPGATARVTMHTSPVDAVLEDVVWSVTYSVPRANTFAPPMSYTVEVTDEAPFDGQTLGEGKVGLKASSDGRTLTITDVDGLDYGITVTVSAATTDEQFEDGRVYSNTYAEVVFTHDWQEDTSKPAKEATCSENGEKHYECSVCHAKKTVKTPMLVHVFNFSTIKEATCTEEGLYGKVCRREGCGKTYADYLEELGMKSTYKDEPIAPTGHDYKNIGTVGVQSGLRVLEEQCKKCDEVEEVIQGDLNGDGKVTNLDIYKAYLYIGKVDTTPHDDIVGDVNGDGKLTNLDIYKIFKYTSKQINSLE